MQKLELKTSRVPGEIATNWSQVSGMGVRMIRRLSVVNMHMWFCAQTCVTVLEMPSGHTGALHLDPCEIFERK